ncbi:di-trans,poly-cis-decaprenylcistransferase [Helicobacter monodelphidis]|uniref:di-trans,poly-cis-decaprenylcistransferase n=1 Tax=Helicobacter sp. 15-1451 TaxID=2004995 RepID=UPI000DCC4BF0|nr:di-trans,poly-cis-decaprenylcistransferase [Helicobacter sp. 15-1451]RAX58893.1 di-trans,poly-cis-decaprenylcistransferase [Helicobacter sp. 15-1451]
MNQIRHVAIIMDGNGRWAKQRNLKRSDGHRVGAETLHDITRFCAESEVEYLSIYGFSTENWNRPKLEVDFLMKLLKDYLRKERETYLTHQIAFKVIGNLEPFRKTLKKEIAELEAISAGGKNLMQILALNYGSRDEILRACKKILHNPHNIQNPHSLTIEDFGQAMDTNGIPDVDMLIRTGGEKRISNFLLWQSHYAELFFSDTLWPDFKVEELACFFEEFKQRDRRFGKIQE